MPETHTQADTEATRLAQERAETSDMIEKVLREAMDKIRPTEELRKPAGSLDGLVSDAIADGKLPTEAALLANTQPPIYMGNRPDGCCNTAWGIVGAELRNDVTKAQTTADSEEWAYTIDFAPFSRVDSRDANGFLRAKATVTAPGVYAYIRDGKLRHELKPADEIFSPLHMASVHGAVVTDEHPPGAVAVSPTNSKELQRGHSMSAPTETADGMLVDLVVTDGGLIEDAESGRKKGVSLGMRNTFENKPGVWTAPNGSKHPYDVIQRNMVTNHIAIVSRPRVTSAQLHLDSLAQDETEEQYMANQATVTIDGADFEIDANVASIVNAARSRDAEKLKALQSKLDEATTSYDSLTAEKDRVASERDKFEGERDALKEQIASTDAIDIDAMVLERTNFLERVRTIVPEDKLKPLLASKASNEEIMKFSCDSHDIRTDGKTEGYIEARFDVLVSNKADSNGDEFRNAAINPAVTSADSSVLKDQNDALAKARAARKVS